MPVKKTAAAKKTAAKKSAPAKKTAAKKAPVKNVKKPAGKRGGFHREINESTGFVVGTDQDAIALALLDGGESRAAIVEGLEDTLDTETRNGTPKQITNMVSGVLNKMIAAGYTVESSFVVVPPTPASKRAASRAANKKAAAPAKKTPAKKSAAKPAAKKTAAKKTSSTRRGRK
jgi:hypothetical protein